MKTGLLLRIGLFLVSITCLGASRETQWAEVRKAVDARLPKSAAAALQPIITGAIADQAYAEATKALAEQIVLQSEIQGNKPEERITRLQAAIEKQPEPMRPALEAILAHWYWEYFQQNRWRFHQRTQTGQAAGADLQTWDLARILTEIDRHFTAALAHADELKRTPIAEYGALLTKGTAPDAYRPTAFDFFAYDALAYYQAGENAATQAEEEFEIKDDGPAFAPAADFMAWKPQTPDATSPKLKAVRLYQELLAFHQPDRDRSAFYDADLQRLGYGHNVAVGEDKEERYRTALETFIRAVGRHPIAATATAQLAESLVTAGEPAKAHDRLTAALKKYAGSPGADECANAIGQIEAKSVTLQTEHVWNAPWPPLTVTYRNTTTVYFRALPMDFRRDFRSAASRYIGADDMSELLTREPALEWKSDLPPTPDFKERTEAVPAPTSLRPGLYLIVASGDPGFTKGDNHLSSAPVWVSDLALVTRVGARTGSDSGLVVNARTGEPIPGAKVTIWEARNDRRGGEPRQLDEARSDANGQFQVSERREPRIVLVEHGDQAVSSLDPLFAYGFGNPDRTGRHVVFFTDRAIYRPGQTIHYKGIALAYDQDRGTYGVEAGRAVTVSFRDVNGQEFGRATQETNDYGSFAGVLTAPRDRLMGQMSLRAEGSEGTAYFRVEEYKRPKFQVDVPAPAAAAKLGEPVSVTVKATAYTGAAIGGAKVKWRVTRSIEMPYWCWWWRPTTTKAIAHGSGVTTADGALVISFTAEPDRTVPAKNEPVFAYTVTADVTDTTGETRSDERAIRIGYTALQANVTVDEWQVATKPAELDVSTRSLDGEPRPGEGTVSVYALVQPDQVQRGGWERPNTWWYRAEEPKPDPANPESWQLGPVVAKQPFHTDASGKQTVSIPLGAGIYRAVVETKDHTGKAVTARRTLRVVDAAAPRYPVKEPNYVAAPKWTARPGETFRAVWGTGYSAGRAFVEVSCDGKLLQSYWTSADRTLQTVEQPVSEKMRGGFTLRVTYVRENRAYITERKVDVPWSNKELTVKWESFRSKLEPGKKETWAAVISGPDGKRAAAEMVAAMYDASLDQYEPHTWPRAFGVFRQESEFKPSQFQNRLTPFMVVYSWDPPPQRVVDWRYRGFPSDLIQPRHVSRQILFDSAGDTVTLSAFSVSAKADRGYMAAQSMAGGAPVPPEPSQTVLRPTPGLMDVNDAYGASRGGPDLSKVSARRNLNETAFFFPTLVAGEDGLVRLSFTVPEALTEWKFLGFAHDTELRAGLFTDKAVTSKDVMVEPNPPRFVREGDELEFAVKVTNQTDRELSGQVRLTFAEAETEKSLDRVLQNQTTDRPFTVPAKQSRSYFWRIVVPDGLGIVTYKAVAATGNYSDGEEGALPVLSRRVLVHESLPLPIRGPATKSFEFEKLLASGSSPTLKNQSLTVQMVSQPAWYAVMALPYLMEYPYECSEQVFNRYYANELARHIADSDPKIRRVFDAWRASPTALKSPLEKNQELKTVVLEETPWIQQAKSETEARRNVGLLFDDNRLESEAARSLETLAQRQGSDGLWAWFPGGRPSEYISLYVMTGFGRLRHLGVRTDVAPAIKAVDALDGWMEERYQAIQRSPKPGEYVPGCLEGMYLYGRSFFLDEKPITTAHRAAVDFYLAQARKYWTKLCSRQVEAFVALGLQRFGDAATAQAIARSLKERSVTEEEMGMFWRDTEASWWWYDAPIETQAMMIEVLAEVANDAKAVEDCQVWLLKQKQTQDWRTTKATADAVYALLLRGGNLLASDAQVAVSLGGRTIEPEHVEAGTGFYEQTFVRGEIKPELGHIVVHKTDPGVSWGSVHWQYLEDVSKVTPYEGTPLKVKKTLWTKETTAKGPGLKPVTGAVVVGDELVVRIELRSDRDMEFVHLKDARGSGTEPVNVLSRYKFQDGLAYYESTRDTATHFFIDYLPKGTYVFEYSVRVQLKGEYQTGMAEIQCMYAPEFNSHSESLTLVVR